MTPTPEFFFIAFLLLVGVCLAAFAYLLIRVGKHQPTVIEEKRQAWGDAGIRFPPTTLSGKAAKGFHKDDAIMRDAVSRAERDVWVQPLRKQ